MQVLYTAVSGVAQILRQDMNILGYTFSLWSVLMWVLMGSLLIFILHSIFD